MSNETIADIVAEMRTKAKHFEECSKLMVSESALALFLYPIADRIEAAAKQEELRWAKANGELAKMLTFEKAQGGNSAAMREALEFAAKQLKDATEDNTFGEDIVYLVGCMRAVASVCRQTLSSPPRNCDLPLVVDGPAGNNSDKAWRVFKRHNPDAYFDVPGLLRCIDWLLAPATERKGEEDGSK